MIVFSLVPRFSAMRLRVSPLARVRRISSGEFRAEIHGDVAPAQFRERFTFLLADGLAQGLTGDFERMDRIFAGARRRDAVSPAELLLIDAILVLSDIARWNIDVARPTARRILAESLELPEHEPLYDAGHRKRARILSAVACLILGDDVRGRRALRSGDGSVAFFNRISFGKGFSVDDAPEMLRGYAMFLNIVIQSAERSKPKFGLTIAELQVLDLIAGSAMTRKELAEALGKTENTINKQVAAIYEKLDVSSRAELIQKARILGFVA